MSERHFCKEIPHSGQGDIEMIRFFLAFSAGCLLTGILFVFFPFAEEKKEQPPFQVAPQGSFPGLHIQNYEFAIPLNRMELTALVHADAPNGLYGSGGAPMTVIVFRVQENGKYHYFAFTGVQNSQRHTEVQYLGEDLELGNWTPAGAGFRKLEFSRKDSSCGYAWLSFSRITGSPAADAAGEYIVTDTRYLHADDYDRQLFEKKSFPVFLTEFQECIRTDDRKTIARMIDFPAELSGKLYFTRSEFLRDYQKIFHSERKKAVLETTIDEVDFNWRGTWIPDGITLNASMENAGPICFIH